MSGSAPIIEIQFQLDDESIVEQSPVICRNEESIVPCEMNRVADDAANSNESFNYSGRHDHGPNSQLKEGGYYSKMVTALCEAKEESNVILSAEIQKQKDKDEGNNKKKPRLNEADAYT